MPSSSLRGPGWRTIPCVCFVTLWLVIPHPAPAWDSLPVSQDRLTIHEWGTFTCLQDETGRGITGINTDDEPVPSFVHRITEPTPRPSELAPVYLYEKGVPGTHRDVQMRLETPVLYFYPPESAKLPLRATVKVDFRGGWLTEYYPDADVRVSGSQPGKRRIGRLAPGSVGSLEWRDLEIGGAGNPPQTDAPVWLAPRQVSAAIVRTPRDEAEKYLFYRGVGNLRSPVAVVRGGEPDELIVREQVDPALTARTPLSIPGMWLVDVRDDGTIAYRALGAATLTGEPSRILSRIQFRSDDVIRTSAQPDPANRRTTRVSEVAFTNPSASDSLAALGREMQQALIVDGLFAEEAEAMLKTWEAAYFKSPGLRLFYLLPREWTDAVLPLSCSAPADVSRSMIGRIEIVTPRQRTLLQQIAKGPILSRSWLARSLEGAPDRNVALARLKGGMIRLRDLNVAVPREYRAYLGLGRFRDALILDAQARDPTPGLNDFARSYGIQYYTPHAGMPDGSPATTAGK
ncbi:MAG TPA: hypothetical protein VL475_08005 [Planctomycetaceae bacterium]|nr:hypothetical protein [Planctomycetaceae bacterium]